MVLAPVPAMLQNAGLLLWPRYCELTWWPGLLDDPGCDLHPCSLLRYCSPAQGPGSLESSAVAPSVGKNNAIFSMKQEFSPFC